MAGQVKAAFVRALIIKGQTLQWVRLCFDLCCASAAFGLKSGFLQDNTFLSVTISQNRKGFAESGFAICRLVQHPFSLCNDGLY